MSTNTQVSELGSNILVAAIDFGTTYSGWAFSFRHEFRMEPTKVYAKTWAGGQLVSLKGPTCALVKPDGKTLDSFGYEAESTYAELVEEGNHHQWYFFKRFKMMLYHETDLRRKALVKDITGKEFSAKKLFSLCIGFLKKDLMEMSQKRLAGNQLTEKDIHWVLTVPAIWNDAAKQFMREAAEAPEAGISGEKLTIALEPECASLYCRYLPVTKGTGGETTFGSFKANTKYLILDAGGGTVDITVHEVTEHGSIKELYKASGGAWGGTKVDEAFEHFLSKLFGVEVMRNFEDKCLESYIGLLRRFEVKKRDIKPKKSGKTTLSIPLSLLDLFKDNTGKTLKEAIAENGLSDQLTSSSDKLRLNNDVVTSFFKESVESVSVHVKKLLQEPSVQGCTTIVMVGGFSESAMLHDCLQETFPDMELIVPEYAGLAVMKGAVIYGHSPNKIAERICKFTYGTGSGHTKTDNCSHDPGQTETLADGRIRCTNIFDKHVVAGQSVKIGEEQKEKIYKPVYESQTTIDCDIYASPSSNPTFITDSGCNRIGCFNVPIPDTRGGIDRTIGMAFKFGGTEIEVKVVDKTTGRVSMKRVDFLG